MTSNREWLKSLSDKQLADEIRYGGRRGSPHDDTWERAKHEAIAERREREEDRK